MAVVKSLTAPRRRILGDGSGLRRELLMLGLARARQTNQMHCLQDVYPGRIGSVISFDIFV